MSAEVQSDDTKTCPQCAEEVKAAALVCRFCGYRFTDQIRVAPRADDDTENLITVGYLAAIVPWLGIVVNIILGVMAHRRGRRQAAWQLPVLAVVITAIEITFLTLVF